MSGERRSLQDLIRGRQQSGFVGRHGQVVQYQDNLRLEVEDARRRFLFNIHGDAGVGKTYLTKQLRQIAGTCGALTAYTDDTVDDVASAMVAIASEFSRAGTSLSDFDKRAARYQARRQELEADPHAPDGVAAFLTKTAVAIGMSAARDIPFAGSVLAPVDINVVAEQADRARVYLARKFSDHSDVRLLLSPESELTPVFVSALNHVSADRQIALFFDTYERTALFLDGWLRNLYAGLYGDLPVTLVTTISGQTPLNPNLWGEYLPVIADVPLEPFSEAEARQFLASKGISDERMVQVILNLSGRLPMWLTTLADARPDNPANIGDPAGDAVERFLKWETDPARRAVAVTAALPRTLNQDVLSVITSPHETDGLFGWLCSLPFVSRLGDSWRYHEVVRSAMLRLKRAQSPNDWRANHSALAEAYAQWAIRATGKTKRTWTNSDWTDYTCEETYHRLCSDSIDGLPQALRSAVRAAEHSTVRARQWAGLLTEAGLDSANKEIQHWGKLLQDSIRDEDLTEYLGHLIDRARLDDVSLVIALEERGEGYRLNDRYEEALADFDRAIEINPKRVFAIISRGQTYQEMGQYEEALTDFDRVIELDSKRVFAIINRGQTYQAMGRYEEALTDFDRAIELNPKNAWTLVSRAETYRTIGRYEEAFADFDRAVEVDAKHNFPVVSRGQTYLGLGRYEEALADFDRAIEIDPNDWAIANRGRAYLAMGRTEQALADFDRAIEIDPDYEWVFVNRGRAYLAMGWYQEALADFDRAIEISPEFEWAFVSRGETYQAMGRNEQALADFDRAIEIDPDYGRAEFLSVEARLAMGIPTEDLADLDRSIEVDPVDASAILRRGQIELVNAQYDEAVADFQRAIDLDHDVATHLPRDLIPAAANYLRNDEPEQAIKLFEVVLSALPNSADAHNNYGFCLLSLDVIAALAELEKASALGYARLTNVANRVLALHLLGRNDESIELATSEEARNTPNEDALVWIIERDHTLKLSNWIDIHQYLRSLLIHIEQELN